MAHAACTLGRNRLLAAAIYGLSAASSSFADS